MTRLNHGMTVERTAKTKFLHWDDRIGVPFARPLFDRSGGVVAFAFRWHRCEERRGEDVVGDDDIEARMRVAAARAVVDEVHVAIDAPNASRGGGDGDARRRDVDDIRPDAQLPISCDDGVGKTVKHNADSVEVEGAFDNDGLVGALRAVYAKVNVRAATKFKYARGNDRIQSSVFKGEPFNRLDVAFEFSSVVGFSDDGRTSAGVGDRFLSYEKPRGGEAVGGECVEELTDGATCRSRQGIEQRAVDWNGLAANVHFNLGVSSSALDLAIEEELKSNSAIGNLLSGGRNAKLWELYQKRHRDIAQSAESSFLGEIGADFRDAYEEE